MKLVVFFTCLFKYIQCASLALLEDITRYTQLTFEELINIYRVTSGFELYRDASTSCDIYLKVNENGDICVSTEIENQEVEYKVDIQRKIENNKISIKPIYERPYFVSQWLHYITVPLIYGWKPDGIEFSENNAFWYINGRVAQLTNSINNYRLLMEYVNIFNIKGGFNLSLSQAFSEQKSGNTLIRSGKYLSVSQIKSIYHTVKTASGIDNVKILQYEDKKRITYSYKQHLPLYINAELSPEVHICFLFDEVTGRHFFARNVLRDEKVILPTIDLECQRDEDDCYEDDRYTELRITTKGNAFLLKYKKETEETDQFAGLLLRNPSKKSIYLREKKRINLLNILILL